MFMVSDENRSPWLDDNIRTYPSSPQTVRRDDPDFDVDPHVSARPLASGESLEDCVAELMSQRLDHSRPLWGLLCFQLWRRTAAGGGAP